MIVFIEKKGILYFSGYLNIFKQQTVAWKFPFDVHLNNKKLFNIFFYFTI